MKKLITQKLIGNIKKSMTKKLIDNMKKLITLICGYSVILPIYFKDFIILKIIHFILNEIQFYAIFIADMSVTAQERDAKSMEIFSRAIAKLKDDPNRLDVLDLYYFGKFSYTLIKWFPNHTLGSDIFTMHAKALGASHDIKDDIIRAMVDLDDNIAQLHDILLNYDPYVINLIILLPVIWWTRFHLEHVTGIIKVHNLFITITLLYYFTHLY